MATPGPAYRAEATSERGRWVVRIPELQARTLAGTWDEIEPAARALLATALDVDPDTVTIAVTVVPDPATARLLRTAQTNHDQADRIHAQTGQAQRLRDEAEIAVREAAHRLHDAGWSNWLIARHFKWTERLVEQLLDTTPPDC